MWGQPGLDTHAVRHLNQHTRRGRRGAERGGGSNELKLFGFELAVAGLCTCARVVPQSFAKINRI